MMTGAFSRNVGKVIFFAQAGQVWIQPFSMYVHTHTQNDIITTNKSWPSSQSSAFPKCSLLQNAMLHQVCHFCSLNEQFLCGVLRYNWPAQSVACPHAGKRSQAGSVGLETK